MDVETQEIRLARQRASVKWLLSKAFNNRVPDNIKEPFYRDHENQERLKPQIIVELGNATLYCQTLSNIYSDPNYQSLNHWSILQTLSRKGISVAEVPDMPLTETVLIQTNPLRISAHMCVIESLMVLYAREILSSDRVPSAIRRISGTNYITPPGPNCEQSLLAWISHACAALKRRIAQEIEAGVIEENGVKMHTPDIPPLRDFQDTCDGVCLALLISYYCPKVLPWTSVRFNYLPAVEDSIHNVLLVSNFSQKHLPYSVFHMTPEDITYMRGSMKLNLIVLLADLFNLFEVHPAKCVCYPGKDGQDIIAQRNAGSNEYGICHRRGLTTKPVTPIPDLRSESDALSGSPKDRPPFQVTSSSSDNALGCRSATSIEYQTADEKNEISQDQEGYVVHKSRGITTLSSVHSQLSHQQEEPLVPARLRLAKEKNNVETKADERGDNVPAGRPSNWEQSRRPSYAGAETSKKVSAMNFYSYRLMVRENDVNHILHCRRLFHQFVVDMYTKIETERLNFIRFNQKKLRSEEYIHLRDARNNDGNANNLGKIIILPSSYTGNPRHMHEYAQDAMTYVRHYGRPSLPVFLSRT